MGGSAEQLMRLFERNRDRVVLTDVRDGRSLTYGEFIARSLGLAAWLEARGVRAGEAVVFSAENSPELALLYFAALHVGARIVQGNPTMSLLTLVFVIVVVGVLLWVVNSFIPMDSKIRSILNAVVVIALVLWLLDVFGILGSLSRIHV